MRNNEEGKKGSPEDSHKNTTNCHSIVAECNDYVKEESDLDEIHIDNEDPSFQYTVVPNALIRDTTISPNCRWLIIFLLSNKPGWIIKTLQLWQHVKGFIGRDGIRKVLNEAIDAGYVQREIILKKLPKGSVRGYKYTVASSPKFKNGLRKTGFQYTEHQCTDGQAPDGQSTKEVLSEELLSLERENTSLKVSAERETPSGVMPAKAGEMKVNEPSTGKSKKAKTEFSGEVLAVAERMVEILKTHEPDYSPPVNMAAFRTEVDFMLRLDKREPEKIFNVLNWALSDSFWRSHIFKPNPAKYLREKFLQLKNKMEAKPTQKPIDRKGFAPCSDPAEAYKTLKRMEENTL